jgi:hypothetical protein
MKNLGGIAMEKTIKLNLLNKGIEVVYDGFRSILNFNLDNNVRDYEELFKDFLENLSKRY